MSIRYVTDGSSILDGGANVLVCPVNCCAGVMGAGLARAFADRWPTLKGCHRQAVELGGLSPGGGSPVWMTGDDGLPDPCAVYFLATKEHWRDPSKLEWVASGLRSLIPFVVNSADPKWGDRRVTSCAIPKIGCGLGGLKWSSVEPLIVQACNSAPGVDWRVY